MIGRLFSSLSTHLCTQCSASPNPMHPRQMRDTFIPVFPNRVYSMIFSFRMTMNIAWLKESTGSYGWARFLCNIVYTSYLEFWRALRSRYKMNTPLKRVSAAPARVSKVGILRQMANPHNILIGSDKYSNGAATEALARL